MPRVKRGVTAKARHKKVLTLSKGYRGRRNAVYRIAKEAVMKALGTGWRADVEWSDIDTRPADTSGGPGNVVLSGAIRLIAEGQGVARITVSVAATMDAAMATAFVEHLDGEDV